MRLLRPRLTDADDKYASDGLKNPRRRHFGIVERHVSDQTRRRLPCPLFNGVIEDRTCLFLNF